MPLITEKQLNNHFSVVPSEFFGKDGAARFTSGGKRFTATKILSAALLSTRQNVLGDGCKTSYTDFESELRLAHSTTARNVGELIRDGSFKRDKKSTYSAAYSFDVKHGLPVYHFLRTETFNGKRLSGNAVLYLCYLIRFYLNPEREQKYFIGGEKRAYKTINVPQSTAHGVVNELLYADCIHRFQLHNGKLSEGKGINSDYLTVYTVDDKILKRVKEIRKAINKAQADKAALKKMFATTAQEISEREQNPAAKPERRKPSLLDQWQRTLASMQAKAEKRAETLAKLFKDDFTYNQLKRDYTTTHNKYFTAILQNGGEETAQMQELERQLDVILSDVLNFLLSHNIQREELPDDWKPFITHMLRS